jgi:hypothetical protein
MGNVENTGLTVHDVKREIMENPKLRAFVNEWISYGFEPSLKDFYAITNSGAGVSGWCITAICTATELRSDNWKLGEWGKK